MIQDIIRAVIQRIFRDKILMGLLAIGILAVFMTGAQSGDEPPLSRNKEIKAEQPKEANNHHEKVAKNIAKNGTPPGPIMNLPKAKSPMQQNQQIQARAVAPNGLKPSEAEEFVKWWVGGAMDYQAQTAKKNREKAFGWMTEEAASIFKNSFWTPEIEQGIITGNIVAAFQPVSVHATAVNPDGSVVVHVKGSLVMQRAGQVHPNTEHLVTDYLVKKEQEGYRIAGVHSKTYVQQASAIRTYY